MVVESTCGAKYIHKLIHHQSRSEHCSITARTNDLSEDVHTLPPPPPPHPLPPSFPPAPAPPAGDNYKNARKHPPPEAGKSTCSAHPQKIHPPLPSEPIMLAVSMLEFRPTDVGRPCKIIMPTMIYHRNPPPSLSSSCFSRLWERPDGR